MIDDERESIVRKLAAEGVSERRIAKKIGISRTTVCKILRRKPRKLRRPEVCPNCRYTVVLPCVVCGYRRKKKFIPPRYVDNLILSIIYPKTNQFILPHTPEAEDDWDEDYEQRNRWIVD